MFKQSYTNCVKIIVTSISDEQSAQYKYTNDLFIVIWQHISNDCKPLHRKIITILINIKGKSVFPFYRKCKYFNILEQHD